MNLSTYSTESVQSEPQVLSDTPIYLEQFTSKRCVRSGGTRKSYAAPMVGHFSSATRFVLELENNRKHAAPIYDGAHVRIRLSEHQGVDYPYLYRSAVGGCYFDTYQDSGSSRHKQIWVVELVSPRPSTSQHQKKIHHGDQVRFRSLYGEDEQEKAPHLGAGFERWSDIDGGLGAGHEYMGVDGADESRKSKQQRVWRILRTENLEEVVERNVRVAVQVVAPRVEWEETNDTFVESMNAYRLFQSSGVRNLIRHSTDLSSSRSFSRGLSTPEGLTLQYKAEQEWKQHFFLESELKQQSERELNSKLQEHRRTAQKVKIAPDADHLYVKIFSCDVKQLRTPTGEILGAWMAPTAAGTWVLWSLEFNRELMTPTYDLTGALSKQVRNMPMQKIKNSFIFYG